MRTTILLGFFGLRFNKRRTVHNHSQHLAFVFMMLPLYLFHLPGPSLYRFWLKCCAYIHTEWPFVFSRALNVINNRSWQLKQPISKKIENNFTVCSFLFLIGLNCMLTTDCALVDSASENNECKRIATYVL